MPVFNFSVYLGIVRKKGQPIGTITLLCHTITKGRKPSTGTNKGIFS